MDTIYLIKEYSYNDEEGDTELIGVFTDYDQAVEALNKYVKNDDRYYEELFRNSNNLNGPFYLEKSYYIDQVRLNTIQDRWFPWEEGYSIYREINMNEIERIYKK